MTGRTEQPHTSAERIQALLDGTLPHGERSHVEEHLRSCPVCVAEVAVWSRIFEDLGRLPRLVPPEGFADRVVAAVAAPRRVPLAARVGEMLAGLRGARHPGSGRLQDWLDDALPAAAAARVAAHVDGCPRCAGEASALRALVGGLDALGRLDPPEDFAAEVVRMHALLGRLDALGRLAPSPGFAERVMAQIPRPSAAPVPAPAWGRLLAAARSAFPSTRKAWAAVSGVAVTPAVTLGLVLWAVFSHPTLTPGALLSFVWWKVSDAALVVWSAVASTALESAGVFRVYSAVEALAAAPGMLALGLLLFSVCTLASLWVLYKNLIDTHPVKGRYLHASP